MYKSNNFQREELLRRLEGERSLLASSPNLTDDIWEELERLEGERSLLASSPNLTEDIWEELERLDNVINDLQYEIWNSDLN